MDKKTFERYESKLCRLFLNSRKSQRLSGAYLLYGQRNAPLKDSALFLAQSLGCEKELLACGECDSCKRFKEGVRPDFVLIDGEFSTIKKGDIQALENKFSLSALEKGHRLTYVIHRVENITEEAANSLLKFLEEPKVGQVAFLTTYNLDKVLPTILSRSLTMRVDPIEPKEFMKELQDHLFVLQEEGKKDKTVQLNTTEAYLFSCFFSSLEDVENIIKEDSNYKTGMEVAEAFLNDLAFNYKQACFTLLRESTQIKDSKCYNWIYLTLQNVFSSILLDEDDPDNPFHDVIVSLAKNKKSIRRGQNIINEALAYRQLNYNNILTISRLLTALDTRK